MYDLSLALPQAQYFAESSVKGAIALHFTGGSTPAGAVGEWERTPSKVGTAFVVGKDGKVFRVFPPECWAYHLGNNYESKRSIGIEIVNEGFLRMSPDADLMWWPPVDPKTGLGSFNTHYCRSSEADRYVKATYRGFHYWAAFPEAQVAAVGRLVDGLCAEFNIPKVIAPPAKRNVFDSAFFRNWKGIYTHANFVSTKMDIGPAWPWERLA